jgi:hypothetical protein
MTTLVFTPTCKTSLSAHIGKLSNRAMPLALWNYLLSLTGSRGFSFFSTMGGYQLKEATIEMQGHYIFNARIANQLFKKEF